MGRASRQRGSIAILAVFSLAAVMIASVGIFAVAARANRQAALQRAAESAALAGADRVLADGLPAATPRELERALLPSDVQARWSFGEQPDAKHAYAWIELTGGDTRLRGFVTPRDVVMRARAYVAEERLGSAGASAPRSAVMQCTQRDRRGRCTRTEKVACTIGFSRPPRPFTVAVAQGGTERIVGRGSGDADTRGNRGSLRFVDRGGSLELSLRLCDVLDGGGVLRLRWGPSAIVAAGDAGALTLPDQ